MNSYRKSIFFIVLILCISRSQESSAIDAKKIFSNAKESIVVINSIDSNNKLLSIGSGVIIDYTKIVTNYHVVKDASKINVKFMSGEEISIQSLAGIDVKRDLVVLLIPSQKTKLEISTVKPEIGEEILAIGNPKGLECTISNGIISGIRGDDASTYYQITAAISPGSSGGAVVNEKGKVIAITTFYIKESQNLNFAIPSEYVQKILDKPTKLPIETLFLLKKRTEPYTGPDTSGEISGAKFRIHNFGTTELIWYMNKKAAYKQMEKIKSEYDKACLRESFLSSSEENIGFITYGTFDNPNSLLDKNTYILKFRSNSLVEITHFIQIQDTLPEEFIKDFLGSKELGIKSIYENNVNSLNLIYGDSVTGSFNEKAWRTPATIISLSTKNEIIRNKEEQFVVVKYVPRE